MRGIHQTLRITPAMEARLTDWSLEQIAALTDEKAEIEKAFSN